MREEAGTVFFSTAGRIRSFGLVSDVPLSCCCIGDDDTDCV